MSEAAASIFGDRLPLANQYVDILAGRGIEWGLLGPREADRLWDRHVLNCAAVSQLVGPSTSACDVGSGAGLPGIPLAIARPDVRVTLVESLQRRANFLELAVEELGLAGQVRVVRSRAEDLRDETFDVVTCRAVAPLPRLLGWTRDLWPAGELLALKGESAESELHEARPELTRRQLRGEVLVVRAHPDVEPTRVIRVRHDHMS